MGETPWAAMMRQALGLGVQPEAFWKLSLREWRMLTEAAEGVVPMGRTQLEQMMTAWPDRGDA